MKPANFYSSDLQLAAALIIQRHPLLKIDFPTNPNKARFVFEDSASLKNDMDRYYSRELFVPALSYADQIKNLKSQISTAIQQAVQEWEDDQKYYS
jgi:hypothetical protein